MSGRTGADRRPSVWDEASKSWKRGMEHYLRKGEPLPGYWTPQRGLAGTAAAPAKEPRTARTARVSPAA